MIAKWRTGLVTLYNYHDDYAYHKNKILDKRRRRELILDVQLDCSRTMMFDVRREDHLQNQSKTLKVLDSVPNAP